MVRLEIHIMKIVLLTGIYPPAIGGPATYSRNLAKELSAVGHSITVVTYGHDEPPAPGDHWNIIRVGFGIPIFRWFRYAKAIREHAADADIVYAFSSVSCGMPLWLSGIKKPKRILRLGGDFLWERYTDRGGTMALREWYAHDGRGMRLIGKILRQFRHIVFSTEFQKEIYEEQYPHLPEHSVIENALQAIQQSTADSRQLRPHKPFRLLFMGRFVGFKNLFSLLEAMPQISDCVLTLVGDGPLDDPLRKAAERLKLHGRVQFVAPVGGKDRQEIFAKHDLLILPSLTEISPNVALEAAAAGLPVLLTEEHGLSEHLLGAIDVASLRTSEQITIAVRDIRESYATAVATHAHGERAWKTVAAEHVALFQRLLD